MNANLERPRVAMILAAGRGERLKGYNVGLQVFDRPETFDPIVDPVVRIEAARLRDKLREYYEADGQNDPIRIDLVCNETARPGVSRDIRSHRRFHSGVRDYARHGDRNAVVPGLLAGRHD